MTCYPSKILLYLGYGFYVKYPFGGCTISNLDAGFGETIKIKRGANFRFTPL
jgi:hypothetical protein